MTGQSNESFDPEANSEVDPDEYGYQSRGASMRGGGHDSRPRSVWGASVGVVLEENGRRFFISSTRGQQAGAAVSVGDEVVAVDGLNLHGMALGEVNEVKSARSSRFLASNSCVDLHVCQAMYLCACWTDPLNARNAAAYMLMIFP